MLKVDMVNLVYLWGNAVLILNLTPRISSGKNKLGTSKSTQDKRHTVWCS